MKTSGTTMVPNADTLARNIYRHILECGAIKIPHIRNKDDLDDNKLAQKNEEHQGS
jgi:hypothetical protein